MDPIFYILHHGVVFSVDLSVACNIYIAGENERGRCVSNVSTVHALGFFFNYPAGCWSNPEGFFQPETIFTPRGIIRKNFSSLGSTVWGELMTNKQTNSETSYCFRRRIFMIFICILFLTLFTFLMQLSGIYIPGVVRLKYPLPSTTLPTSDSVL